MELNQIEDTLENSIDLNGIESTALLLAYIRAELGDSEAIKVIEKTAYNPGREIGKSELAGVLKRTELFDSKLYECTVSGGMCIQLASGFNNPFARLKANGKELPEDIVKVILDLPTVVDFRKLIDRPELNFYYISQAIEQDDFSWLERLDDFGLEDGMPVTISIEGLLMYLNPDLVSAFFQRIANRFHARNKVIIIFDAFSSDYSRVADLANRVSKILKKIASKLPKFIGVKLPENLMMPNEVESVVEKFPWILSSPQLIEEYDSRYKVCSRNSLMPYKIADYYQRAANLYSINVVEMPL